MQTTEKTREQVITEGTTCPCGSTDTNPKAMFDTGDVDGFDCLVGTWECNKCGQRFDGYEPKVSEGARTIYVVVNTGAEDQGGGGVGAMEWRDEQDALPTFGPEDQRFVVTVPEEDADDAAAITEALDGLLGDYDLPEGYEVGPISGDEQDALAVSPVGDYVLVEVAGTRQTVPLIDGSVVTLFAANGDGTHDAKVLYGG